MTLLIPSPVMKSYTRPIILNYNTSHLVSPKAVSQYLFPRHVNRFTGSWQSVPWNSLATQNKSILCSTESTGSTDRPVGIYKKYKKFNVDLKNWCDKQSLPVAAAVYTGYQAFEGGLFGMLLKIFGDMFLNCKLSTSELELAKAFFGIYYPLVYSFIGSPFIWARGYAVLLGSTFGVTYIMNRLRGHKEEDTLTSTVTGFVSGVMFSLVAGMRSPIIIANVGLIFALLWALMFKWIDRMRKSHKQKMKTSGK